MHFATTRVRTRVPSGRGQVRLAVDAPARAHAIDVRPGQFCELRVPGGAAAPFALLGPPARDELAFLVRAAGDGEPIAALAPGDAVELNGPLGEGFALDRARGRDVVLVATGTGIGPICAAAFALLARRTDVGELTLYYGVRDATFAALTEDLDTLRARGVHVHVHESRPDGRAPERYVQDVVAAAAHDATRTAFIVAGHSEVAAAIQRTAPGAVLILNV